MSFDFFNNSCDLSEQNGFSGNRLDRLGEQRDALDAAALSRRADARFYVMAGHGQLLKSVTPFDPLFTANEVMSLNGDPVGAYLLGLQEDGAPEFALSVPAQETYHDGILSVDLRSITRAGVLVGQNIGAVAQARALVSWHGSHRYCARCGTASKVIQAGYARHCSACDINHFPRTDPVAIMLAVDGDYCLLGRSPTFPELMVSCLAGFIEVGETMEEAVRREIFEEAGVRTRRVRYHSTQAWPFPSSLMMGCFAEAISTEITLDDELEMCRWFSRAETRHILARNHFEGIWSPPEMAIAHQLMRGFVEGF